MIPDPLEPAAWRTFGMLDADESATFDATAKQDPELRRACREMDGLAAAIAVTTTAAIAPRTGQLEKLHLRLGLPVRTRVNWPAISGWAAAAALALLAAIRPASSPTTVANIPPPRAREIHAPATPEASSVPSPPIRSEAPLAPLMQDSATDVPTYAKRETKRLIQEIEVLRDKLESLQMRDRERFETTPGLAWPIVMRMVSPDFAGTGAVAANDSSEDFMLTAMLGDAIAISQEAAKSSLPIQRTVPKPSASPAPSAIPIYDAARDKGTLVVSNLPAKNKGETYNLWVTTATGDKPIHVGRLPESSKSGADSMDFSLGATTIVPSGFLLTRDKDGNPPPPSESSTVLLGPR